MRLAADANVLLSAVIGGRARLVLGHPNIREILTTQKNFEELEEYVPVLARNKRLPADVLLLAVAALPVIVVDRAEYSRSLPEAVRQIGRRDPDDAELLALALQFKVPVWSNDKDSRHCNRAVYCNVFASSETQPRLPRERKWIPMASPAVAFARGNQPRFLNELKDLLRIPSVSTLDEHKPDIQKAANYVADELRRIGMENVEIIPTQGHPLIYADWLHAQGKPTVLCYAHYDVQPAEPLDEWLSPPFDPTERNSNLYARGAVDDKGQLWMEVKALESLKQANGGKLPINVKVIFEGEEEVGGESIAGYIRKEKSKLKSDFALVCDSELFAPNVPTLCVGLRGLVYTEIEAIGAKTDLHSGMYGGAAPNPFFALIEIIGKMKDGKGKILIPGFYKDVKAPSPAELKAWKRLPFNEEHYRKTEVGSKVLTGEPGYSVLYRTWARPTLEVHGMPGGFTAPGAKTVIPAKATAKVSMRLVPNQDPDDISKRYSAFVKKVTPKGIETKIKVHSKGPACVVGTDNPYIKAATEALHDSFKKETVFIRSGGSIPIVTDFQDVLKIPSVMMGFGLPDDNLHAPNEKFHIPNFYKGIETICGFFEKLGKL